MSGAVPPTMAPMLNSALAYETVNSVSGIGIDTGAEYSTCTQ